MSEVTSHQSDTPTDVNNKFTIQGFAIGDGGAPTVYRVAHADGPGNIEIVFQTVDNIGLTNEVLLAIVQHRLAAFQAGPFACPENNAAICSLNQTLAALKWRTRRRSDSGIEGKLQETYQPK